ncbi:hypothetical protein HDV02_001352 [Globomyces sp. JEL0801]|nr:hypothetical protein HDV02_001352 [Globomyces sp. JEL0801]
MVLIGLILWIFRILGSDTFLLDSYYAKVLNSSLIVVRLYTVADWLTYFSWILGAWAVHPPSDVCEANFVVQAGYFEISFSTFVYVFYWPASCPSIYFDRTQWRQPGESLVDYRQRVVDDFNSRNIVRTQPNDIELMRTDDCRLTQTELDTLKILTFTCHEVRRKPSVRSIVSLQQKPKITRPKSIRNSSIDSKRRISSEAFGKTANESSSYGYQTVMTEAESVVVVKLNEANAEEGHGERTTDEVCALCLEDYEEGDVLRELHCNHRYHAECVDSWLIGNKRTCPVCNADACGRVAVPVDSASDAQPSAEATSFPKLFGMNPFGDEYEEKTHSDNGIEQDTSKSDASKNKAPVPLKPTFLRVSSFTSPERSLSVHENPHRRTNSSADRMLAEAQARLAIRSPGSQTTFQRVKPNALGKGFSFTDPDKIIQKQASNEQNPFDDPDPFDISPYSSSSSIADNTESPPARKLTMDTRVSSSPMLTPTPKADENPFESPRSTNLPPRLPPRPAMPTIIASNFVGNMNTFARAQSSTESTRTLERPMSPRKDFQTGSYTPSLPDRPKRLSSFESPIDTRTLRMRPTLETPDTSEVFRGLPLTENQNANDIFHKGPFKSFSVSGNYCVTGSQNVRIWYAPTAENKSTIALNIEVTATSFVSASDISYDGVLVWVAVDKGEMLEIDTKENTVMHKSVVHNSTVNAIIKSRNAMFTFDDTSFRIWRYDNHGRIRLSSRSKSILLPSKKCLFLIVNETQLWASHEKLLEVYDIFEDSISSIGKFDCKIKEHSNSPTLGMITTIAQLASRKRVFTGHEDGKIIVFNSETLTKIHIIQASTYKITTLLGVGEYLWAGLATGKILIFELTNSEQLVLKVEFLAYAGSGVKDLQLDDNSLAIRSTLQVFSSNDSGHIRIWDGLLTQYKREIAMNYRVDEYSIYTPIRILILTYNIDSRKPIDLEVGDQADKTFLQDLVANNDADIYIFGFQELIDLENGAIATRFLIGDSSFCFVNCHLAAHQKQVSQRNNDIAQILKDASFPKLENAGWERGGDGTMILDHENVFWNGDLNYRIDLTRHEAMDCIHSRDYQKLWQYDQLNNQMLVHSFGLRMFKEGELLFDPTFKYDRNTQRYDSSEKMRIPAYCDRILWRGNRVELLAYNRLECKISDHRPVYGSFIAKVRKIDATRYQKVKKDVKEKTEWRLEEQSRQSRLEWLKATYNLSIEEAKQKLQEHNWDLRAVQDFWGVYCILKRPGELQNISDYHFFKKSIRPIWEDNLQGGKWIIRLKKGISSRYWEDLLLAILGDQFDVGDEICGAVISIRQNEDILSLWNKTSDDGRTNMRIRDTMKRVLDLPANCVIEYKAHKAAITDNSSFRNTETYR